MQLSGVEIFGYCASAIIAFSLTRSSILKLRWFNLFGSSSFCLYGLIIHAYPVAILNGFIATTNVIFLSRMLRSKSHNFTILAVNRPSNYVEFFLGQHKKEISHLFPRFFKSAHSPERHYYFLMQGTDVIGVLSGYEHSTECFVVDFDFVTAAYRDFRLGHWLLGREQAFAKQCGYPQVAAKADSMEHERYLQTLGMQPKLHSGGLWFFQATDSE